MLYSHFCWFQDISGFPIRFHLWLISCLGVCCLISTYLWIFQFSFGQWFLVSIVVWKDTWYGFSFIKLVKPYFVTYCVISEIMVCVYFRRMYSAIIGWNILYGFIRSRWFIVFKLSLYWVSLWLICPLLKVRYWNLVLLLL